MIERQKSSVCRNKAAHPAGVTETNASATNTGGRRGAQSARCTMITANSQGFPVSLESYSLQMKHTDLTVGPFFLFLSLFFFSFWPKDGGELQGWGVGR